MSTTRRESGEKDPCARLLAGETCALVTDAGSPAISDPGEDLVRLCAEHGVTVCAIPGPCALVTALSISGLPTGRFTFEGFLSVNKKSRQEHLTGLKDETRTMIFYEAPHKLLATLQDLSAAFGAEKKNFPVPGADEAPRGGPAHDAGRGRGLLRGKSAPGRVRARRGRRGRRPRRRAARLKAHSRLSARGWTKGSRPRTPSSRSPS